MNHILKKVIQCVVSIFCVLGMVSTTGKSIKAEGEETSTASAPAGIYIDQNNGDDANDGFTKSTAVKTGDSTHIIPLFLLMICTGFSLILFRKRNTYNK